MEVNPREAAVAFGATDSSHSNNDTTLAMDMKTDATLGCAYFSSDSNTMFLFQEVAGADMVWVDQLLFHAQRAVVLLPARAPENLVQHLERLAAPAVEGIYLFLSLHQKWPFLRTCVSRERGSVHSPDSTVRRVFL